MSAEATRPAPSAAPAAPPPPGPPAPPAAPARAPLLFGLSDRLNPVLVREVHQALGGRGFLATAGLALLAVVLIALGVAAGDGGTPRGGAEAFHNAIRALIPILFFLVPAQIFLSMRTEVAGGTVEHLLLSRLRPAAIVRGKLLAATVQFGIYLALFAPLLATTFLLRGVDVPTIAVTLLVAFFFALACSALAIACGALCRWQSFFRAFPYLVLVGGLGMFTVSAMGSVEMFAWALARGLVSDVPFRVVASFCVLPSVLTVLFGMIAASALAHPYENRSTPFRLFALGTIVLVYGWSVWVVQPPFPVAQALLPSALVAAPFLGLFALFASTEEPALSPRMRIRVPRRVLGALLVVPWLPGSGRGLLFSLLLACLALAGAALLPVLFDGAASWDGYAALAAAWCYVLVFSGFACRLRELLGPATQRNWVARAVLPVLLLLGTTLPLLASLAAGRSVLARWNPLHILNPFETVAAAERTPGTVLPWLVVLTLLAVAVNLVPVGRGVAEVLNASRARRSRAS